MNLEQLTGKELSRYDKIFRMERAFTLLRSVLNDLMIENRDERKGTARPIVHVD